MSATADGTLGGLRIMGLGRRFQGWEGLGPWAVGAPAEVAAVATNEGRLSSDSRTRHRSCSGSCVWDFGYWQGLHPHGLCVTPKGVSNCFACARQTAASTLDFLVQDV